MKISYDGENDALYIRLVEGNHECRTLRLTEEIALNIGEGELLVGIEVLDASEVLGQGKIPNLVLENVPFTVFEALLLRGPTQPGCRLQLVVFSEAQRIGGYHHEHNQRYWVVDCPLV